MQLSLLPVAAGQASDEGEQTELTLLVYLAAYPWEQILPTTASADFSQFVVTTA